MMSTLTKLPIWRECCERCLGSFTSDCQVAGFELGSGMFIYTVLPEAAAEFLRNVQLERAAGA